MISIADKKAAIDWDEFVKNMNRVSPVDFSETPLEKQKRLKRLEADNEAWFQYYFSAFYTSEPAPFHKRSTNLVMHNPEYFVARPWSRETSKSGRTMMEVLKLTLTGKKRNVILTSATATDAERLLKPFKSLLENNDRIINDYGRQQSHGSWQANEFITRKGVAFRAIGAGQSPRGTRNDEVRPDVIIIDDFDTDQDCRNPEMVDNKYDWLEKALFGTRSISNPLLIIFNGNIIAEHCCMLKAMEVADSYEVINIRDKNGKSTWPQKNTEEYIDIATRFLSYKAIQGEYYNNPITEGRVFKDLHYKKMQPLKDYRFLVAYCDPSYKSGKKNDYKALCVVGRYKDEFHVLQMFCDQTTTAIMIDWFYQIVNWINGRLPVFYMIEWPWIDDSLKLELQAANIKNGSVLPLTPDPREKTDKYYRIESLLEPLNRREKLWFNIDLKPSQFMKNTESQFKALSPTSRAHDDAPDCVEGAVFNINSRTVNDTLLMNINRGASRKNRR